jgi:hypothetical protein
MKIYKGKIGAIKAGSAFAFIPHDSVSLVNGQGNDLAKHDIFVHRDDCDPGIFVTDSLVTFEVIIDEARSVTGARRAKTVKAFVEVLPAIAKTTETMLGVAPSPTRLPAHVKMKEIPPEAVAAANRNKPLEGAPRNEQPVVAASDDPTVIVRGLSAYLEHEFPAMHNLGLNFNVVGYDATTEKALVDDAIAACQEMGMEAQGKATVDEYGRFKATRDMLAQMAENKMFSAGSSFTPSLLKGTLLYLKSIQSPERKQRIAQGLRGMYEYMAERGLMPTATFLPLHYLPEMFAAAPVTFVAFEDQDMRLAQQALQEARIPTITSRLCNLFPNNSRWACLVQLFNHSPRPLQTFRGDVIPPSIVRLITRAKAVFDNVLILTPYLDIAGDSWRGNEWQRAIDPFVVGISAGSPVFCVLGRFSNSPDFPLLSEMIADTMAFVAANKQHLKSMNARNITWYRPEGTKGIPWGEELGHFLFELLSDMEGAYAEGRLFDWMRGTWPEPATHLATQHS